MHMCIMEALYIVSILLGLLMVPVDVTAQSTQDGMFIHDIQYKHIVSKLKKIQQLEKLKKVC